MVTQDLLVTMSDLVTWLDTAIRDLPQQVKELSQIVVLVGMLVYETLLATTNQEREWGQRESEPWQLLETAANDLGVGEYMVLCVAYELFMGHPPRPEDLYECWNPLRHKKPAPVWLGLFLYRYRSADPHFLAQVQCVLKRQTTEPPR